MSANIIEQETRHSMNEPLLVPNNANGFGDGPSRNVASETGIQVHLRKVWGRSYAANCGFWFDLSVVAFLGTLSGLAGLAFLVLTVDLSTATISGTPKWLIVTSVGGLLSGLILLITPGAITFGADRSFFPDVANLKGKPKQLLSIVLASGVALATGAPLGPELVLSAMGSATARALSYLFGVSRRREACWIYASLSASLGCLVLNPLLSAVLVHELSVAFRSDRLTFDAVAAAGELRQQGQQGDANADAYNDENNSNTNAAISFATSFKPKDHDYLEGFTLQMVASTMPFLAMRLISPLSTIAHSIKFKPVNQDDFALWHLAAAIPLGVLCAAVGSSYLIIYSICCRVRKWFRRVLQQRVGASASLWTSAILFSTLAGVLHGCLTLMSPIAGSSLSTVRDLWNAAVSTDGAMWTETPTARQLSIAAAVKMVGLGISIGFGLIGGSVVPMAFSGFFLGLALEKSVNCFPLSLVIPCCLAATPLSCCPTPVTAVIAVSMTFNCSPEQTVPVAIASAVAWTLSGGMGLFLHIEGQPIGLTVPETIVESPQTREVLDQEEVDEETTPALSDAEILEGIRSTIFGGA